MTCNDFDYLTDDNNGRDIDDYTNAEVLGMVRHMRECPRCWTKAHAESAVREMVAPADVLRQDEERANRAFDRIVSAGQTDPEL